jgi:uncharacterized membrane protein YeaQ/YmgE (transglycosylase-associated protein family)
MGILSWIIIGLIAGWLAGVIMKGSGYGLLSDIGLGILGAVVGGFLAGAIFGIPVTGFNLVSLIIALVGAIIVVAAVRALPRRSRVKHL